MANTIITPSMVTRESLRILHQKLNFIRRCQRQYDDRFAQAGAKIGTALQIRKPNRYTVATGAALATQDTTEQTVTLTVATQKHVDVTFSSVELTMQLDDFAERILEPAMAQLAAAIEADALTMYRQVYSQTGSPSSPLNALRPVLFARKRLEDNLTPPDGNRSVILNTDSNAEMVDALKGLFHSADEIEEQYEEGMIGRTAGFTFMENTLLPVHTPGNFGGTITVDPTSATTGSTLVLAGFTASQVQAVKAGDVFTIGTLSSNGVFGVHKETRNSFGYLQQFVVTADANANGAGQVTVGISPAITTSGPLQTVSLGATSGAAITFAGTAATAYGVNLAFHKDAFAFATADLEDVSQFGAWGAREVYDGISMRIARQWLISTDYAPCRIDVLYGFVATYPELAARIANVPSTS